MSRPTIYDVAEEANVGIGTVSRVLNDSPRVSDATRQKVLRAIDTLGFRPSSTARMMARSTKRHNIGVITQPFLSHHSFVERLRGVQLALQEEDEQYELVLYNVSSHESFVETLISIGQDGTVESLIIIDLPITTAQQEVLQRVGIPFVRISNEPDDPEHRIGTNNEMGGYLATQHLLDLGHRTIAYVGDHLVDDEWGFTTSKQRLKGYQQALSDADLAGRDELVRLSKFGKAPAKRNTLQLLQLDEPPTAVFAMSDVQALGCIAAVRAAGLSVPDDVAIVGYDNLELSQYIGLSTVEQHLELSGYRATRYLLQVLQQRTPTLPTLPEPELIMRLTSRPSHTE